MCGLVALSVSGAGSRWSCTVTEVQIVTKTFHNAGDTNQADQVQQIADLHADERVELVLNERPPISTECCMLTDMHGWMDGWKEEMGYQRCALNAVHERTGE